MDLPGIDLNLLVALHALLQERSVTRAGERIGLSQPATSAALARLRRHFADELLIRDGRHYVLTPLAGSLLDQSDVALRYVQHTFAARPAFDAATSDREFSVAVSDYALTVLGGPLLALLARRAPDVRLRVLSVDRRMVDDAATALREVDVMVLPRGFVHDLPWAELYRDRWVAVCAEGNTLVGDALTLDDLGTVRWIVNYHAPAQFTPVDKHMDLLGIARRADVVVENFVALPFLLAGTQRICLLQDRLARRLQASSGVRLLELPLPAPELVQTLWWHPARAADPGHRWLRELIREAAAELEPLAGA